MVESLGGDLGVSGVSDLCSANGQPQLTLEEVKVRFLRPILAPILVVDSSQQNRSESSILAESVNRLWSRFSQESVFDSC